MYILGISAFFHDSAAALIKDGQIVAAAQEERFSRIKNDSGFPEQSIRFLLESEAIQADQIDHIVFYDKPWLKFERIIESSIRFAPRSMRTFINSMPIWLSKKLNARKQILDSLVGISTLFKDSEIFFSEHHFSHAASSFYTSPFNDCCSVTIDGVGEWATTSIIDFDSNSYKFLKEMHYPHSIGLLYSAFTFFCGFKVNSGEYKLMGLAPYGEIESIETNRFVNLIKEHIIDIKKDGSIVLDLSFFKYQYGHRTIDLEKWECLFGLKARHESDEVNASHANFALAAQKVTEEIIVLIIRHAKTLTSSENLCLSGGVALNCVANAVIRDLNIFDNIWIHPSPGDAGASAGAALAFYYKDKKYNPTKFLFTPYLGPEYSDKEIESALRREKLDYKMYSNGDLYEFVASELKDSKIVGWFQSKMEWGPRALGNRSILANALDINMQKDLNLKIKFREGFRPFAPVILEENSKEFFENCDFSPYMQYTHNVLNSSVTKGTASPFSHKLSLVNSSIPAVTHFDLSARVQTVNESQNKRLFDLISVFKNKTGYPLLINTSFNVRGEPIVCTPQDAISCFLGTHIDLLVLSNYVVTKDSIKNYNGPIKRDFEKD